MSIKNTPLDLLLAAGFLSVFSVGMFGAFGAIAHYLYTLVRKGAQYSTSKMLIIFVLGFFVGVLVNAITLDTWGKSWDGVILLSGFLVLRILDFLDANGLGIILKRLGIKIEK